MTIELEIQIASNAKTLPHPSQFKNWVSRILDERMDEIEITIRIVDEEEITELNRKFREKNSPTNVLAFPAEINSNIDLPINILGDVVICASVVEEQAKQANKELLAHWAHMVTHGVLHLLGYDHQNDHDAKKMEDLETKILIDLGFPAPYN